LGKTHKTEKCDHIVKIAEENKYYKWETVWDGNMKLRNSKDRHNPLLLFTGDKQFAGDEIKLPPKGQPSFNHPLDKDGVYKVPKLVKLCLRLRILLANFTPAKGAAFELIVKDGKTYKGKTDDNGCVKAGGQDPEIPKTCTEATLYVQIKADDAKKGDKRTGGGEQKKDDAVSGDYRLKWKLQIGRLNPLMEKAHTKYCISGVQQRLNNLGFYCGKIDGIKGPNTKLAIERFQSLFNLKVDNIPGTGETQPKLAEVHDTGKAVTIPPGDKEPTKTVVKEKEFRKTTDEEVGHVAPDFVDSSEKFYNTLVVAPEYRIKLELGKIDDLFLHKADTRKGRMERMQVAGLFYFPMNHQKAETALDFGWKYYCDKLGGSDDALKDHIRNFVVDGGKLPPPADDPAKPKSENFKKLRFPGGYTYLFCPSYPKFKPNHDTRNAYRLSWTQDDIHDAETMCIHDNPVLGAIPLAATVEMRYGADEEWKPAKEVMVYFQLVDPYELPAYDKTKSPLDQLNRPPLRESDMQTAANTGVGPAKHVRQAMAKVAETAKDPQKNNCPKAHGGKRESPPKVADTIFEIEVDLATHMEHKSGTHKKGKRPGFNQAHTNPDLIDKVKEPFFEQPEDAAGQGEKYKHAVRAKTNEKGFAGVVFKPSTVGGDRYRIRAFIGPPTLLSDGTDKAAVMVETGTLVVWRSVRVSKMRRLPCTSVAAAIQSDIKKQLDPLVGGLAGIWLGLHAKPEETLKFKTGVAKKDKTQVGYADVDVSRTGDASCKYDGFVKQMARSFCELLPDAGADSVTDITAKEWGDALQAAVTFAKANNTTANAHVIDVDKLVITDKTKVSHSNTFVMIPVHTPLVYNSLVATNKLPLQGNKFLNDTGGHFDTWFDQCLVNPFIHDLADDGYLPGLVILQVPTISTWHATANLGDYSIGLSSRGCIVLSGKDNYPYPNRQGLPGAGNRQKRDGTTQSKDNMGYSGLVAHEWGHCLFRDHAPPNPSPGNITIHDLQADGYCVMSYETTEGDYCGKCVLALQGWSDIKSLP
jgi:hypothetical protein